MVTNGKVRVVRFFSKALVGPQLNWSVREKECYGIFYGVRLFEDLLDNRPFILKTDHMNLTYLNVTLTGKVLRWKLYLQDKDFHLCHCLGYVRTTCQPNKNQKRSRGGQRPCQPYNPSNTFPVRCMTRSQRSTTQVWASGVMPSLNDPSVSDQIISTFIRQCPCCQVMT